MSECGTCGDSFNWRDECYAHMNRESHWIECETCDKVFLEQHGCNQHMASTNHWAPQFPCSGISHHLETGSCPKAPNLNRQTIAKIIRRFDYQGIVANKQLEWHEEENVQNTVTNRAYNGYNWECYLCHREFGSARSLTQHLNLPAHAQKAYHCPNRHGCQKQFVSLAALFNHLESESCQYMRFENVQSMHSRMTESILSNKRIAMA
ncbi:hypothetical protein N7488_008789 [Penicillium malachiteum]|nr:hypothetical protein N7488_008789 [Penicillium malachiteum]